MRFSLVPPRSYDAELMDRPENSYEELALALRDIGRVNRWLGGIAAVGGPLQSLVARRDLRRFTLLDVGTGGGEIPRAILASASRRGMAARAAGIDIDANIVRYAGAQSRRDEEARAELPGRRLRSPETGQRGADSHLVAAVAGEGPFAAGSAQARAPVREETGPRAVPDVTSLHEPLALLRSDGFALPFGDASFDFVISSLMFHHFREVEASRLLREMARVARRAVIVNDLARHLVPWAAIRFLSLFGESPMVRHDGPLSVLRGWTAGELESLARDAGLGARARVERRFPYRLVLVIEKDPGEVIDRATRPLRDPVRAR